MSSVQKFRPRGLAHGIDRYKLTVEKEDSVGRLNQEWLNFCQSAMINLLW